METFPANVTGNAITFYAARDGYQAATARLAELTAEAARAERDLAELRSDVAEAETALAELGPPFTATWGVTDEAGVARAVTDDDVAAHLDEFTALAELHLAAPREVSVA